MATHALPTTGTSTSRACSCCRHRGVAHGDAKRSRPSTVVVCTQGSGDVLHFTDGGPQTPGPCTGTMSGDRR